ncbi:Uncharacterised protein g8629 [Pycnogonum litorale]
MLAGSAASRHLNRRRSSSPHISPKRIELRKHLNKLHAKAVAESITTKEISDDKDDENKESDEDNKEFDKTRPSSSAKTSSGLCVVTDVPPGVRLTRRRAVDTSDHKTCALVQTRLKKMKFQDVA